MSASMLNSTIAVADTRKKAITGLGSMFDSDVVNSLPIPLQPKTVSVTIAPEKIAAKSNAISVASGINALRNACLTTTVRLFRPLARAVRT